MFILAALGSDSLAQTASVVSNHDSYHPGEPITVSFSGGPGAKKDWIGVYPEGVVPGTQGATLWNYVDNTRAGNTGFSEGLVTFPPGLNFAGTWFAYLLANDGYTKLAETSFSVVDPGAPLVHSKKRVYKPGETLSITFANGPANSKDWVGIYPDGVVPGSQASTLWFYVDGTGSGAAGKAEGTILFNAGLDKVGNYVAFLLENDGYTVLARETFKVQVNASDAPRILSIEPANESSNAPPAPLFSATVFNASVKVVASSLSLSLDGVKIPHLLRDLVDKLLVTYAGDQALPSNSKHVFSLVFADTAGARYTNAVSFTIGTYNEIKLPSPLFMQNFDSTPEGKLPPGWTEKSYSEVQNEDVDFNNLDSGAFKTWTTVDVSRFRSTFVTYSNPETAAAEAADYQRVLRSAGLSVVNGSVIRELAQGRMIFGNSGYRRGRSQVMFLTTPDFDLSGKSHIFLSYHSLWEQNQDSIAAVEYSIDAGQNWLPVVYHLDPVDVKTNEVGQVDIETTFTTEYGDVARYTDEQGNEVGGSYGAFLSAKLSLILPEHVQARINDSPSDGKRVELFRLSQADGQKSVRVRFAHAGTDSWYWGLDDVGVYSINPAPISPPRLAILKTPSGLKISSSGVVAGTLLESTDSLSNPSWTPLPALSPGIAEVQILENQITGAARYYRLRNP